MIKDQVREILEEAVQKTGYDKSLVERSIFRGKFGDYSSRVAFSLNEANSSNQPEDIAKEIVLNLKNHNLFNKVEIAGNAFINFYLSPTTFQNEVQTITEKGDSYSKSSVNKGKKARVEYISSNPTGPLHLGNARGGPLGDVLANVLEESGFEVLREYIHNDIGGQVERLGRSVFHYIKVKQKLPSTLPEDGYQGKYVEEIAQVAIKEIGLEKLQGEENELVKTLADFALNQLFDENLLVIEEMAIDIDKIFNESDFLITGETKAVVEKLTELKLTKENEEALWFAPNDDYLEDREAVLVRSNGQPTYFANDIAYHNLKFKSEPDLVVDVFGSNHHGHVPKLQAAIAALGYDLNKFRVVLYQYVRLKKGGEIVKMSKRAGDYVSAAEVLEEVGKDVFRFFLLQRSADTHMDFDLEAAKSKSDENPVFYVQYAHARMAGILAKESKDKSIKVDLNLLKEDQELALIKKLSLLPELVESLAESFAVHQLTNYSIELADSFNSFYESARVITEDKELTAARLSLVHAAKIVLGNTLRLMGISAPERM